MAGDCLQQPVGHAVRVGVQHADPAGVLEPGQPVEEDGQAVSQAEVLSECRRVLTDQRQLPSTLSEQVRGLVDHGLEAAAAKAAPQLRNDAEGARVVAAFVDLEVREVLWRCQPPGCQVVVEVAARRCARQRFRIALAVADNGLDLVRAQNGVDLRNLVLKFSAVPLHQAPGHDEAPCPALCLVPRHLEDSVDRLLLRGLDEAAGVDHQRLSLVRLLCELMPAGLEQPPS